MPSVESTLPPVDRFAGEFSWLSNMHPCDCPFDGKVFPSSEHLYQWLKVPDTPQARWWKEKIRTAAHGKVAKKLAANPKCPKIETKDWIDFRLKIMEQALRSKFESNPDLMARLIGLGPREIVEGNVWNDTFWGICNGRGDNHLGRLLMRLRGEYLDSL